MKKSLILFSTFCLALSCSYSDEIRQDVPGDAEEYTTVVMTVPQSGFEDSEVETRNEAIFGNEIDFVWSVTDSVGIFPDAGSQIYFSMASGAGQKSAAFDGGGWALKKGSSYFSYFPFLPDSYIDKTAIPLTYVGQSQKGNAQENRADLGRYGYMVAKGVADDATGSLYFNYRRLGCLFRVKIPVHAGTYESLTLRTDDDVLIQSGTYNAVELDLSVDNPVYGDSITLDLEDVTFSQRGTLVSFFMLAPFAYENRQVTMELTDSDGNVTVSSFRGKDYEVGMTYGNAPHISVSPSVVSAGVSSESFTFDIAVSKATYAYTVTSDVPWLTLGSSPASGDASVTVTVAENTSGRRVGHIEVAETVSGVLLKNVITVTQSGIGDDVDSGENEGVRFEDWNL